MLRIKWGNVRPNVRGRVATSQSPPRPVREDIGFINKMKDILQMELVITMQQGSQSAWDPEQSGNQSSSGYFYSDSPLLQWSYGYGICIFTLV